jgi:hypothetical protein
MVKRNEGPGSSNPDNDSVVRDEVKVIDDDNTEEVISALCKLKNKIKNKK